MARQAHRQLHRGHLAFMRAIVQGIDAQSSWDRYLHAEGEPRDGRKVKRTVAWIRDAFAAAARRAKRPGLARLILMDSERLEDAAPPPTLEEFAEQHGLTDFSYSEQLEAYQAAFASETGSQRARRRTGRRQRLIAKQLEALRWLEQQNAVHAPNAADELSAWLDESIARRLARSGFLTLSQLVAHVNAHGARWWLHVPGVGAQKGARVLEWLQLHADQAGIEVGAHTLSPRRLLSPQLLDNVVPSGTALRPYEKFEVPPGLDGGPAAPGERRHARLFSARNDREAIDLWLAGAPAGEGGGRGRNASTTRAYRKEAERLLLWSVLVRGKAVSSLAPADLCAYREFLAAPPPDWCGPRHVQRWSPLWRPLEGPLAPTALDQAMTVLRGLFGYWLRHGYVARNPVAAHAARRTLPAKAPQRRLSSSEWTQLEILLEEEVLTSQGRRLARAVRWLRFSELGLAFLATLRCEQLRRASTQDGGDEWTISPDGAAGKTPKYTVPAFLVEELEAELRRHGRPGDVTAAGNKGVPVLARFEVSGDLPPPWSASGLAKAVRVIFNRVAQRSDSTGARRWMRMSVPSLRATAPQVAARRGGKGGGG